MIAIYGFYDKAGTCMYIGQSWWPQLRQRQHYRLTPNKKDYEFRILRWCDSKHKARIVEKQVINAYWRRGQAGINVTSDTYAVEIVIEHKGIFYDYKSAREALGGCARNTVKNWAKDGYWYDLNTGRRMGTISIRTF